MSMPADKGLQIGYILRGRFARLLQPAAYGYLQVNLVINRKIENSESSAEIGPGLPSMSVIAVPERSVSSQNIRQVR
jgi:hypothetical protein